MSMPTRQELLWRFGKSEDPEIEARRRHILEVLLEDAKALRCALRRIEELLDE